MRKVLITFAALITGAAILLAIDPGRYAFKHVDAEGHQLRMLICGHGNPTVVFETGGSGAAGGPLEVWERVQPGVSKFTTAVAYDRAGIGLSAPGPQPRDARQIARELHAALRKAGVAPPYILVGHSLGGPYIRVFAGMYPQDISGMVLVDPTQEEFIQWNQAREAQHQERQDAEWRDIMASLTEAHESPVPLEIPVALITAMGPKTLPRSITAKQKADLELIRPMWLKCHAEWLKQFRRGQHIITRNSGHVVPFEEPELIIRTIREMVEHNKTP